MPALIEAWRAGFCPWPAVSIWPRITSETRGASTPARSSAALMAVLPSSWAGNDANAPLNAPTGVRVALTITTSSFMTGSFRAVWGYYDAGWPQVLDICHREAAGPRQGAKARKAAACPACLALAGHGWPAITKG